MRRAASTPEAFGVGGRMVRVAPFEIPAHGTRIVAVGVRRVAPPMLPVSPPGTPPPFADPGGTTIANAHLHVVFAPFAGARVAELGDGQWNAATSIGLLRDAIDPQPPASSRDYIAAYTHPMPAGTFNRAYVCARDDALTTQRADVQLRRSRSSDGGGTFLADAHADKRRQRVARRRAASAARSALESAS